MAAVTGFLYAHGANITDLERHSTDPEHLRLPPGPGRPALERAFQVVFV